MDTTRKLRIFLINVGRRTLSYPFACVPMGILCLAAYVRDRYAVELRLLNQRAEDFSEDEIVRKVVDFDADIVGFSVITTSSGSLHDLVEKTRRALPKALIALGGPHPSSFRERVLKDTEADVAVVGEGERTFEAVVRARLEGQSMSGIPGLIWRAPDGQIVTNPGSMPLIEDLDSLPLPAFDLIDLARYGELRSLSPIEKRRYIPFVTSRGCPYHCNYCHNIFGKRWRMQSSERIVDDVTYLTRKYGIRDVDFLDDIFNLDGRRVTEVCQGIQRRDLKLRIATSNGVRTDLLTREVVDAFVDAGWYYSVFSLETGSPRLQELIGKRLNISKFLEGLHMSVRRGVFSYGLNMLGHPTETEAELHQTIDTMVGSETHIASFFIVIPFPSTPLYEWVKERSPERLEGIHYDGEHFAGIHVNLSNVPDDVLFRCQRKAYRRFYLSPWRIAHILRHYPKPSQLPSYLPIFLQRATKGLLSETHATS
jgi:anaerobic magnesium-protoporphyrin IX monomethyl ester cyclase